MSFALGANNGGRTPWMGGTSMQYVRLLLIITVALLLAGAQARPGAAPTAEAQTPGENGKIAYELNGGISVITPGTAGGTPLVAQGRSPAWSADGRKLAYVEGNKLVVIDESGSGRMDITPNTADVRTMSWSPDGNKIVFSDSLDLFTVEVGQTSLFNLTNITNTPDPIREDYPEWGALGTRIAFWRYNGNDAPDISILTLATSAVTHVSGSEGVNELSWSPDETKFAFMRHQGFSSQAQPQGGSPDIWVISASGGTATNLTNTSDIGESEPSWSPDGTKIAYGHNDEDADLIKYMDAGGSGKTEVTPGYNPAWQPVRPVIAGVEFTQGIQELQTVFELRSDLAGDDQPPVPIVAGKPAVARVYFGEVNTTQSFSINFDGMQDTATISSACTPEKRREQEGGCFARDFYFTPPSGTWSKRLIVRDFADKVVFDETFTIKSIETDDLILKAVSVCDTKGPGIFDPWECQDPAQLMPIVSTLRKVLPTTSVNVALPGTQIRRDTADFATEGDWWAQVMTDLYSMYGISDQFLAALGVETVYYGVVRNTLQAPAAYIRNKHVAASRTSYTNPGYEAIQGIVMHGVGQALGLYYNNTSVPGLSGGTGCQSRHIQAVSWPYADNLLRSGSAPGSVEVGFDVFVGKPVPGDKVFDMMGLCFSPGPDTAWLSPFNLNKLLDPVGPLSAGPAVPQAIPASVPADFWLFSGTLDDQAADVGPIWTLELDLSVDAGSGTHRIEILDGSAAVLFTRNFTPAEVEASEDGAPTISIFSELVPVQAGAATLRILSDTQSVLAEFPLNGDAPSVDSITLPQSFSGVQPLTWSVSDPDDGGHTYWIDYSPDNGATWVNLAMNLEEAGLAVDFDSLAASEGQGVFRVIATDGVNSGEATSAPFTVGKKLPHAEIIGPTETSFHAGQLVMLEAAAWDIDDGTLNGDAVTWTSSRDGALGTGASLPLYDLSVGSHTITMTARDSDDNTVTDSITISVSNQPIVEGEEPGTDRTWGDVKCDGNVNLGDSIAVARTLVSLDPGQSAGCPAMGGPVTVGSAERTWGDVDCSGALGLGDAIAIARFLVGIVPNVAGCPVLGSTVKVQA
jgi:Tol biopolymer transport system component